jgi:hypothetical protein
MSKRVQVDALEMLDGGVGDLAAEPLADERRGLGQEFVDAGGDLGDERAQAKRFVQQLDPFAEGVTGQEPLVHQAQLGAGDEHDLGPSPPELLRALGAVGEQRQQLVGGQLQRIRRKPDLQAEIGGVGRGELQPFRITAHDADRVAVQVVAEDLQLALDHLRVEGLAGVPSFADEAGVVADALAAHASRRPLPFGYGTSCTLRSSLARCSSKTMGYDAYRERRARGR